MRPEEIYRALRNKGMFMLVSTRKIAKEKILNLYYTRNQIEEVFRIGKKDGKMLPLGIESEDALCGHLLMSFVSSTILKILSDRLTGSGFSVSDIFSILRHQTAIVHEEELITSEPVKKMNQIYKWFKIKCPTSIPQFTIG
jgi:transposase